MQSVVSGKLGSGSTFKHKLMRSVLRSTLFGSVVFAAVSLAAYSIWAFVPKVAGSEKGMYAIIAVVYLAGACAGLSWLLDGERRLPRFCGLFLPAFICYALAWSLAWFVIKGLPGEWTGSAAGSLCFAFIAWRSLGRPQGFWLAALMLFVLHSAGYFAGRLWMYGILDHGIEGWTKPRVAMAAKLGWGVFHGLGFGAGIGYAIARWQRRGQRATS